MSEELARRSAEYTALVTVRDYNRRIGGSYGLARYYLCWFVVGVIVNYASGLMSGNSLFWNVAYWVSGIACVVLMSAVFVRYAEARLQSADRDEWINSRLDAACG